ncbi:MAG: aspartate 1-decarboxylase [Desulfovibrio sp.]|nr:aspartate 1-decarboxylase [Desulfovibrio sp.]
MIQILRAKLHGIHVTGCDLNYHGSITLDPTVCAEAGIYPLEFVYIWNKNNGQRISTYVMTGEAGSRCCILNGAAARTCQIGDPLIISCVEYIADPKELCSVRPRVVTFDDSNSPLETFALQVTEKDGLYELMASSL